MPTLLQINVTSNWGSTGKIAEQIGVTAQHCGWKSYIAYGRHETPSQLKTIKIGNAIDVYEHYIENRFLDREGLASRRSTKHFLEQIDEINPDIVHLHNIHDHYLNYKLLFDYLALKKIPVVWTQHDCWAFTGHCAHFDGVGCNKWKQGCCNCPLKKSISLDRSKENYELKKNLFTSLSSLTLVPVSDWLGSMLRMSFLKEQSICVIKNGINLDDFKQKNNHDDIRAKYNLDKRKIIMGCASVWTSSKGFDDFIKLRSLLSISEYTILLVGVNKEQISELPKGIIGLERTNTKSELVDLYSIADVFVNPTYSDTYPTTNLEALACGLPVITYQTGGSPESIDEKTGVVIERGNIDALANAVIGMTKNPLISEACRKRAEEYFDSKKCFEKYINLYNQILRKNL